MSLLETTAVIAILSILTALALPPLRRAADRAAVTAATTELVALFALARHAAVARSAYVTVAIDSARGIVTVFAEADTIEKRELESESGIALAATRDVARFAPNGVGYGAANLTITLQRGAAADTVIVSRTGRVRH